MGTTLLKVPMDNQKPIIKINEPIMFKKFHRVFFGGLRLTIYLIRTTSR
jgi:hypothetical protein